MTKKCEKCGVPPPNGFAMLDYCAVCSKDLCEDCMAAGHCGNVPALSGAKEDENYVPKMPKKSK